MPRTFKRFLEKLRPGKSSKRGQTSRSLGPTSSRSPSPSVDSSAQSVDTSSLFSSSRTSTQTRPSSPGESLHTVSVVPASAPSATPSQSTIPATSVPTIEITPAPDPPQSKKQSGAMSTVWAGAKTVIYITKESADAFPILKAAAGGLYATMQALERVAQNKSDYAELEGEVAKMVKIIETHQQASGNTSALNARLIKFMTDIQAELDAVANPTSHNKLRRFAEGTLDSENIQHCRQNLARINSKFELDTTITIERTVERLLNKLLRAHLHPNRGASFDAALPYDPLVARGPCMPGTRVHHLQSLIDWAIQPSQPPICWLTGPTGVGKTTISYSFCQTLKENGMLAGSFFFTRLVQCDDITHVFRTLAAELGKLSHEYGQQIADLLHDDDYIPFRNPREQFQRLIAGPWSEFGSDMDKIPIFVLDDLDLPTRPQPLKQQSPAEAEAEHDRCVEGMYEMLSILLELLPPLGIKVLVTSRPVPDLFANLESETPDFGELVHHYELGTEGTETDIELYLTHQLAGLADADQIATLTKMSSNLFFYAAATVKYIKTLHGAERKERLKKVLDRRVEITLDGPKRIPPPAPTIGTTEDS